MWRKVAVIVGMLVPATALHGQTTPAWDEKYYNPQPAAEDMILPMPCGGAMAFRAVATPNSDGAIGDVGVVLGQEGDAQPFLNGARKSYVSGPFRTEGEARGGFFWMAKYELAEAQYAAVMAPACPQKPPRRRDFVPAVGHGKLEFETFAERYTLWLMANAPDLLPQVGTTRGFLRLPTEEEWEYAARGGLAVSDALFRAPLPPVGAGESASEFIAHGGSDSANGKLQIIGTLKPNALGLHDMLGNASEIVGTPFALVRHNRLHGQAGGYVKRGGDARTPLESLGSATRYEVPPYDLLAGTATSERFTGTRLVLSALSITSPEQSKELIAALDALTRPDPGPQGTATEEEALALLAAMSAEAPDSQSQRRIARIREVIDTAQAERNSQRDEAIRLIMTSAVILCDQSLQGFLNAVAIRLMLEDFDAMEADAVASGDTALAEQVRSERAGADAQLAAREGRTQDDVGEYANFVEGLAAEYSGELLARQSAFLQSAMAARSERRGSCLALLDAHLDRHRAEGFADVESISADFKALASAIAERN